jgi:transcriptional regulator with XRE-family HTH domain
VQYTKVLILTTFAIFFYDKIKLPLPKIFYLLKNNKNMATLGSKLLKLRQEHKFSQMEIAEKLDVSQNAYCKWEADKCKPGADNLQKIAVFYNIDMSDLLDDNEKISLSGNEINGENNIIANTIPTINIQISKDLIEKVLQNQENITKMLEMQLKLFDRLAK